MCLRFAPQVNRLHPLAGAASTVLAGEPPSLVTITAGVPPVKMGSYVLLEQIGQGGMGVVYRARHEQTGQIVAVKVMTAESMREPILLKRFAKECSVAARLQHPHIVRGLDFGVEGDRPYLVMELVDGQSLGQRIRQQGPLREADAVRIIVQIAGALHLAHETKLIHRDVKPDNILLDKDDQAKLTDLGLIKDLDAGTILTKPRSAMGTIVFTPPEQFENAQEANALCDVYGLGATLYYALTGVMPFQARGNLTLLQKKLRNDFPTPRRLVPSLSERVDQAVCMAIDARPDRRPSSCQEFAELLTGLALGTGKGVRELSGGRDVLITSDGTERRRAPRYPSSRPAAFQLAQGEQDKWRAQVNDISLTGICLQLQRRCERHAVLSVELLDDHSDLSVTLTVRVTWVRQASDGTWRIGCAFAKPLTEEELTVILGDVDPTVVVQPREWDKPTEALPGESCSVAHKATR
jgi:serine/threonine protein kinase